MFTALSELVCRSVAGLARVRSHARSVATPATTENHFQNCSRSNLSSTGPCIFKATAAVLVIAGLGIGTPLTVRADEPVQDEPYEFESAPSVFFRDSVDVLSVVVGPNGKHLVAAFYDGSVITLDRKSRKPIQLTGCHDGPVSDLAISKSGELLITAGYDGTVRGWRLPGFEPASVMTGHDNRVIAVALSPDGRRVASCGFDKSVRVWSVESGTELGKLTGHDATVRDVAFSPDGLMLASAGDDGTVRLWDVESLTETGSRSGHAGRVRTVGFSPDGRTVAAGGEDGAVLLWSVADSDEEPRTLIHDTMIRTLSFSPGGSLLAAGGANGSIHLWDVQSGRSRAMLEDHEDAVTSLSFAADSKTLFSSSFDGLINSWSAKQPPHPALATIEVKAGKVWATAVSSETSRVAVGGRGGFIRILDLTTGAEIAEVPEAHPATVDCLEFSRDGSLLAAAGWRSDEVIVWRTDDQTRQQSFKADGNIRAITFSPDGKRVAAGCEDKMLFVWDVDTGEVVKKVGAHSQPVYDVSFSPDGNTIATCCGDWTEAKPGRVKLWKSNSLTEVARLDGHELAVRSAVFDPVGSRLASVSENGVIRIWDVATQTELAVLRNSSGARPLEWSPDGKLLAAGLHDGTTNIWDVNARTVVRRFGGNEDTFSVRFVPDGSVLIGAGGEKQITLWDTSELIGDDGDSRTIGAVRNWVKEMP